jgi:hypothetical protein
VSNSHDRIKSDEYGSSGNAGIVSVRYPSVWIVKRRFKIFESHGKCYMRKRTIRSDK